MQIVMEVNNPHYEAGLNEMAQVAGLDVNTLCAGLIEQQVAGYNAEVQMLKRKAVTGRITERLNRIIEKEG